MQAKYTTLWKNNQLFKANRAFLKSVEFCSTWKQARRF